MTDQPQLRIITASTTPEEVAAIVTVLSALGSTAAPAPAPRSQWADPARGLRAPVVSRGWRASALPR